MHSKVAAAQPHGLAQHMTAICAAASVLIAVLATSLAAGTASLAAAHDAVVGGSPANGAVVEQFPARLELEFSGQPKEGFNTFALSHVTSSGSEVLYSGEPIVEGRKVSLELPDGLDAGPGEYRIGFQIISSDGHTTKGMTSFTYGAGSSEDVQSGSPAPEDISEAEGVNGKTGIVVGLGIVGIIAIAAVVFAAVSRKKRLEQSESRGSLGSSR